MTDSPGTVQENAATSPPWTGLAAGVALIVAFRIPAFLEPHWYSDESTYAYVGRTVFGGGVGRVELDTFWQGENSWNERMNPVAQRSFSLAGDFST